MRSHKMSIKDALLKLALEPKYKYKGLPVSMLGIPAIFPYKQQSVRNTLSLLQKQEYIKKVGEDRIMVQAKGISYLEEGQSRLVFFTSPFSKTDRKNLLIIFDIPEDKKVQRNWLRKQLLEFHYTMIQKSTWLGPSPLPKEFVAYLRTIGIHTYIKFFILAKNQKFESF